MQPLVSPQEMASADAAAISAGTPAEVLMDRAGRAVARAAIEVAGGRYDRRALVVCGKGNNGGDGFVAARRLLQEGVKVTCVLVGDASDLPAAAQHHLRRFRRAGGLVRPLDPSSLDGRRFDVVIDALLGTGSRGAPQGDYAAAIKTINAAGSVVAVDIPSGVDGATGSIAGEVVDAGVTVAIQRQKLGTALAPGSSVSGKVVVVPIGIQLGDADVHLVESSDVRRVIPQRGAMAHKGSAGSVALLAGSPHMTGAAVLAARAADRSGAGYVRVGTVTSARQVIESRLPEALVSDLGENWGGDPWARFEDETQRSDALIVGPGLGDGDAARALVEAAVNATSLPLLLDADGLNVVAKAKGLLDGRSAPTVMTPHVGEMARLLGIEAREVLTDTLSAARRAAEKFGSVVLLKGARTVVARPDGRAVVNPHGSPSLATAGSGDVLSGVIGALLAEGLDPFAAAWAGAAIHGRAGEICADGRGTRGVVAWDVAEALPLSLSSFSLP